MTQGTRIVVQCPDCDEQRVSSADVRLRECVDDETWSYRFTCPSCRRRTVSLTTRVAALGAVVAGVLVETWRLPSERCELPVGEPLTLVSVLELHELLLEPDWFDRLASTGEQEAHPQ